jgi:SMI1/KNR4 family protein SUKH-1
MTIQTLSARLAPYWHSEGVTQSVEEFDSIERALGVTLPADYKYFMMELGAGEGKLTGGYVRLYPLSELPLRREEALGNVIVIGSDGGDQGFGFDVSTRRDTASYRVVEFPISALEPEEVDVIAESFERFLRERLG